tara:strand:+ start:155 stop:391 length:237 start_codon:yes stop_codon:yes gene_type:complete
MPDFKKSTGFKLKNPFSKKNKISRVSRKLTAAEIKTNDPNASKSDVKKEDRLSKKYYRLTEGSIRSKNRQAKKNNKNK